ncbi:Guanine nucleotide exchange factor MSS4 [Vanrija pseudolonga]|uniref:Guanine nucleotide exchange factor MSS4 n=1 Tax=Vanrija pseudolonga TaxID=143232 RepID=A0AAF0YI73_9TREE|nr:Guanine nucleotide exchange factor MSS4 [Vanrija pseudolonga]
MSQQQQPSQEALLAALAAQSSRAPPPTKSFAELAAPADLTTSVSTDGGADALTNSRKIYCTRERCGAVILQPGVGEWVEAEPGILPAAPGSPFPAESTTVGYWYVRGSPFAFDNIGFSRPDAAAALPDYAPGVAEAGGKVKWLICAECDLGPLGWSFEGGKEAWLAVDRLRYAAEPKAVAAA